MVQWRGRRESDNVEDRRGEGGGGFQFPGGSGGGLPFPMPGGRKGGGIGIVGLLIMLGIALLLGINPLDILTGGGNQFPMPKVDTQGKELPKFDLPNWPGTEQVDSQPGVGGAADQTRRDDLAALRQGRARRQRGRLEPAFSRASGQPLRALPSSYFSTV